MPDYKAYPEEDSADLDDEEIRRSIDTTSPQQFAEMLGDALIHLSCGFCSGPASNFHSCLRRRKPHVYSRSEFSCRNGHVWLRTYRVDWLLRS